MKNKLLLVCSLATAVSAMTAAAVPTNITVDSNGNLLNGTGIANMSQYGQTSNSPDSNVKFLLQEISNWNSHNPTNQLDSLNYPQGGLPGVAANIEGLTGNSFKAPAGYKYVVLKFGNNYQAWFLGGKEFTFTAPSGGFGTARLVPDGGSTVMLLGAALGVIAVARRKFGV